MEAGWWSAGDGGITVAIRVIPGARRSEVVDATGGRVRIRVAAPAREGKANLELVRFVAELFGVRRSAVSIVRGEHARDKALWVAGVAAPPTALESKA